MSVKPGKAADFKEEFRYPLYPVLISITLPDGSKRSTTKNKLCFKLITANWCLYSRCDGKNTTLFALEIRYFRRAWFKNDTLYLKYCKQVQLVADSQLDNKVKVAEQTVYWENTAVIIKSKTSQVQTEFQSSVKNDDDKIRIIDLLLYYT